MPARSPVCLACLPACLPACASASTTLLSQAANPLDSPSAARPPTPPRVGGLPPVLAAGLPASRAPIQIGCQLVARSMRICVLCVSPSLPRGDPSLPVPYLPACLPACLLPVSPSTPCCVRQPTCHHTPHTPSLPGLTFSPILSSSYHSSSPPQPRRLALVSSLNRFALGNQRSTTGPPSPTS